MTDVDPYSPEDPVPPTDPEPAPPEEPPAGGDIAHDVEDPSTPLGAAVVDVTDALTAIASSPPEEAPAPEPEPEPAPEPEPEPVPEPDPEPVAVSDVFVNAQHATEVQAGLAPDPTA